MWDRDGVEVDLVTHDLAKFARLLLRPNGYVLEQLLSPLVVHTTQVHAELADLVPGLLTSHHADHYQGFAATQWKLFARTGERKPLLYTFRVLLTGIHLMRTGQLLADLPTLAEQENAPGYLNDLIAAKARAEHLALNQLDLPPGQDRLSADIRSLRTRLDAARAGTHLPAEPTAGPAVNDLVVRARLAHDHQLFSALVSGTAMEVARRTTREREVFAEIDAEIDRLESEPVDAGSPAGHRRHHR
jgi:hypothetical protein